MKKAGRIPTHLYLLGVTVAMATFFWGCKPKESEPAKQTDQTDQTEEKPRLRISRGCAKADTDENGQVSEKEAAAYYGSTLKENRQRMEDFNVAMVQKFDIDKNGKFDENELLVYRQFRSLLLNQSETSTDSAPSVSTKTPAKTANTDKAPVPRISKGCVAADTDENGQVSEEEASTYYGAKLEENRNRIDGHNLAMMQKSDTNHDGILDQSELGEYLQFRSAWVNDIYGLSKSCTKADKDENGQTTHEEATAYYKGLTSGQKNKVEEHNLTMMKLYDTNKDGLLEKSEIGDYIRRRAGLLNKFNSGITD